MTDRYHHGDLPNALRRAAADVITERGLGGFSLREVARRAGVSHTAPLHHFGDVNGLLTSLAIEGFEYLLAETAAAVAEHAEPADQLLALGQAYVRVGAEHPAHCQVMFRSDLVDDDDERLHEIGWQAYAVLRDVVGRLLESEHIPVAVDDAAKLCWAAMEGLLVLHPTMAFLDAVAGNEPVPREDLVERFNQTIIDGLRSRAPRRRRSAG